MALEIIGTLQCIGYNGRTWDGVVDEHRSWLMGRFMALGLPH